ncbi:MAG: hypothetical protein EOO92_10100 [Pedobacter sp.]|nr:MAG: hypothetical protein EOO92_10100 [Pedobacter sp.]
MAITPIHLIAQGYNTSFELYNKTFNLYIDSSLVLKDQAVLSKEYINKIYDQLENSRFKPVLDTLTTYKETNQLNDWLYYQLIRKTAESISPKKDNYESYTLYKWFLMIKSGYDARLTIAQDKLVFYIYNDEDISDIPFIMFNNKKYMCLNYHDYKYVNLADLMTTNMIGVAEAKKPFSYKVTRMPDFKPENYREKKIEFSYKHKPYHFNIKLNPEVSTIFKNYPGVDFESYFNIPLTKETYSSLIPLLKKNVSRMDQKKGVDYIMKFTRYAFLYQNDEDSFGKEKRLSPEETLFSEYSDCDDRVALFFYLVKEIYNLPMIALLYPTHITMAVQFEKPVGDKIVYNGKIYSVCEPTPQAENLGIGKMNPKLKDLKYQIVYSYQPIM